MEKRKQSRMKSENKKVILLADSGSTKTDWCLVEDGQPVMNVKTTGINPFFQTEEEIGLELKKDLIPKLIDFKSIDTVYFYGAGCAFQEMNNMIVRAITHIMDTQVEVGSDLLGAARSLYGNKEGIACIMGTGSNSCLYDGKVIINNVPPLGFILGDEGSGATLGKLLVGDCLKNRLSVSLQEKFFEQFKLSRAEILDKVYKQPFPNRFLAGFSPFLAQNIHEPQVYSLVKSSFKSFFVRNVMQYDYEKYTTSLVGSIAYFYQDILREITEELGIKLGSIEKSPMAGLIAYHSLSVTNY